MLQAWDEIISLKKELIIWSLRYFKLEIKPMSWCLRLKTLLILFFFVFIYLFSKIKFWNFSNNIEKPKY